MDTNDIFNPSDDELLSRFFEAQRPDITDNGFSADVMRRLPRRARCMNKIWSAICAVMAAVIFLVFDGVDQLRELFGRFIGDAVGYVASFDLGNFSPVMMALAILVFLVIGINNLVSAR